jgi:hypothetical protein
LLVGMAVAHADPWAPPGDLALRSDLQLLADEGIVRAPLTSWPLSWADLARDLDAISTTELRTPSLSDALARLRAEQRRQTRVGIVTPTARVAGAEHPTIVRGFQDTPREQAEVGGGVEWIGDRLALRLQGSWIAGPSDGKEVRFDGSYLGMSLGNLMLSVGYMEKWWGPGWAGSLILSNNARPIPSITIERNYSDPFETKWLRWLGPWRASFQAGRLEGSRNDYRRAHFMALRLSARPARGLEIGVSRAAQLCGDGRTCTLGTYWDMIIGNDNDQALADQPGNQLAGYDFRWAPSRLVPIAVYGQMIGEDEAGSLPAKFLGLGGAETWGRAGRWSWRAYGEYAHTACAFSATSPIYGCAYESSVYTDGYRYRGRAIGHAYDRDGEGWTAGAVATRDAWSITARAYDVKLNEYGTGQHTVAPDGGRLKGLETSLRAATRVGWIRVGLGYDDVSGVRVQVNRGLKAFVEWRHAT